MADNPLIGDSFFKENPTKIMGEQTEAKGRWGTQIVVKGETGNLDNISAPTIEKVSGQTISEGSDVINTPIEEVVQEVMESETSKAVEEKQRSTAEKKRLTFEDQEVDSFREILEKYNPEIDRDELEAYLHTHPDLPVLKYVDKINLTEREMVEKALVFYNNGSFEYRYLYLAGNINKKLAQLTNADQDHIRTTYSDNVYETQLELLTKAKPKAKTIGANTEGDQRIVLLPHSDLSHTFKITETTREDLGAEYSLNEHFRTYLRNVLKKSEFKKSRPDDIIRIYLNNKSQSVSQKLPKEEKKRQERLVISNKQRTKEEGDRLFEKMLVEELIPEDKLRIEYLWNEKYNGLTQPDLSKIPVAFSFSRKFKGIESGFRLSKTQRDGVAYIQAKQSGILAYDVGVGKTLSALACVSQAVENGQAKFPLVCVPNNVYFKFMEDSTGYKDKDSDKWMYGALPHFPKVRGLYNLNKDVIREIKEYSPNEEKELNALLKDSNAATAIKTKVMKSKRPELPAELFDEKKNPKYHEVASNARRQGIENLTIAKNTIIDSNMDTSKKEVAIQTLESEFVGKFMNAYVGYVKKGYEYAIYDLGEIKEVPEGTISFITYEGLKKVGIQDYEPYIKHIYEIMMQGDKYDDPREASKLYERLKKRVASAMGNTKVYIEDLMCDMFIQDEAHKSKKIFTSVKGQPKTDYEGEEITKLHGETKSLKREKSYYDLDTGQSSATAEISYLLATYIQKKNFNRNVILLTATPFENNPLEIYSMLSLCNHRELIANGFTSLKDFFDTFMKIEYDIKITPTNEVVKDVVLTGFNNLPQLRALIRNVIHYKTGEEANVARPEKITLPDFSKSILTSFKMTDEQASFMRDVEDYIAGDTDLMGMCEKVYFEEQEEAELLEKEKMELMDEDEKKEYLEEKKRTEKATKWDMDQLEDAEQVGVRILQGLSMMRQIALSPYLYKCKKATGLEPKSAKDYIKTSPKLDYVMECVRTVREHHLKDGSKMSGQVIYMNAGVPFFKHIKQYLVKEIGFKEEEIGIISGKHTKTPAQKEGIKRDFLSGKIKVLIGSKSIEVGVDLQENTTVLYNCYYDWNPTDAKQVEGRIWRQGNRFANVRIVYPMLENSSDVILFQYLGEKTARLKEIWDMEGVKSQLDLKDFDPDKLKYELMTDPVKRAQVEIIREKDKFEDELIYIENQMDDINLIRPAVFDFRESIPEALDIIRQFNRAYQELDKRKLTTEKDEKLRPFTDKLLEARPEEVQKIQENIASAKESHDKKIADSEKKYNDLFSYLDQTDFKEEKDEREWNLYVYRKAGEILKWIDDPTDTQAPEITDFKYKGSNHWRTLQSYRGHYKLYYDLKKKILDPLGVSEAEIPKLGDKFNQKIEGINEQIKMLDDTLEERVSRIKDELAKKTDRWKTAKERAQDFANPREGYKGNDLLDDFYKRKTEKIVKAAEISDVQVAKARLKLKLKILKLRAKKAQSKKQ